MQPGRGLLSPARSQPGCSQMGAFVKLFFQALCEAQGDWLFPADIKLPADKRGQWEVTGAFHINSFSDTVGFYGV